MLVLVQTPAFAQPIDQYVSIVDQYANGDENGALNRLAPDGARISSAIVARMRTLTDRQVRSAIMLHTELAAVLLANARAPQATVQIGNAQRLLEILTEDTRRRAAAQPFAIRWYAFATNLYSGQGLFVAAFAISRDGWAAFPHSAEVAVARGAVYEMRATLAMPPQFQCDRRTRLVQRQARLRGRGSGVSAGVDGESQRSRSPTCTGDGSTFSWATVAPRPISSLPCAKRRTTVSGIWPICFWARRLNGATIWRERAATSRLRICSVRSRRRPWRSAASSWRWATPIARARSPRRSRSSQDRAEDPWWNYQLGGFEPGAIAWLRAEARRQ